MDVHLHLGAHKTASTHLQKSLERAEARLRESGVAIVVPPLLRGAPMRSLTGAGVPEAAARLLVEREAGARRLVISEENLLGRAFRRTAPGVFYPAAGRNISRLVAALGRAPDRLYLGIRSPETFLVSAYGERLRHDALGSFGDFLAGARPEDVGWADLARRLRAAAGGAALTVWAYEDHAATAAAVLSRMTGQDVAPLRRVARPGLSARAIAAVEAAVRSGRDVAAEGLADRLARQFPKGSDWPAWDPWSEAERAHLHARYAEDIAALKRMDGVTFLAPGG